MYPAFTSGLVYTFRGAEGGEKVERADWPLLSQLVMVSRRDLQLSSRQLSQAMSYSYSAVGSAGARLRAGVSDPRSEYL